MNIVAAKMPARTMLKAFDFMVFLLVFEVLKQTAAQLCTNAVRQNDGKQLPERGNAMPNIQRTALRLPSETFWLSPLEFLEMK